MRFRKLCLYCSSYMAGQVSRQRSSWYFEAILQSGVCNLHLQIGVRERHRGTLQICLMLVELLFAAKMICVEMFIFLRV